MSHTPAEPHRPGIVPGDEPLIGIGAAARRFGLAESALRYWEQRGLLRPGQRRSRWRYYGPDELPADNCPYLRDMTSSPSRADLR